MSLEKEGARPLRAFKTGIEPRLSWYDRGTLYFQKLPKALSPLLQQLVGLGVSGQAQGVVGPSQELAAPPLPWLGREQSSEGAFSLDPWYPDSPKTSLSVCGRYEIAEMSFNPNFFSNRGQRGMLTCPRSGSSQGQGTPEPRSSVSQAKSHFPGLHCANSFCGGSVARALGSPGEWLAHPGAPQMSHCLPGTGRAPVWK